MNCQEFSKQVSELIDKRPSHATLPDGLSEHAARCPRCRMQLEVEQSLTSGLQVLAVDEQNVEAPSYLRSDLLATFENRNANATATVITFPSRTNWARWALAAAATVILGVVLFSLRLVPTPVTNETARNATPEPAVESKDERSKTESVSPISIDENGSVATAPEKQLASSQEIKRIPRKVSTTSVVNTTTEVASSEVKSEFVPLTYLNNATAMESGIVVRVEIAREQLATLGLPFDLERADDIIKADIVLGDDGVARAIRLVQ